VKLISPSNMFIQLPVEVTSGWFTIFWILILFCCY